MAFWKNYFPEMVDCIRKKLAEKSDYALQYEPNEFWDFAFIDENVTRIRRPAGGPAEGMDVPRYDSS